MKNTYIKYQNCKYPTDDCDFWADCVVYFNHEGDELVIPNEEWTYHEEDIVVESKTFKQHQAEIDYEDELYEKAEVEFFKKFGDVPYVTANENKNPDLHKIQLSAMTDYYNKRNEYVQAYLKAHTPHQISFPADTSD